MAEPETQATKFQVGEYVRFIAGQALGNGLYPITDPSEWNANSPMLVIKAEQVAGGPDRFTLKRETTVIGTFDGKMLVKAPDPVSNPPAPTVPDQIP